MKPATRQVLDVLRARGADGATEAEIQSVTAIRSGAQRIHELRRDGYAIETVYERSAVGARYARFYLTDPQVQTFAPITGVQEVLF